eukprot:2741240-Amphidinium_carterae.1
MQPPSVPANMLTYLLQDHAVTRCCKLPTLCDAIAIPSLIRKVNRRVAFSCDTPNALITFKRLVTPLVC